MRLRGFISSIISILVLPATLIAQQNNFRTYTIEDGLPHSTIYCIMQDSRGYLWLGTEGEGISRFDGKNFTSYNQKNGLSGNNVRSITQDSKGKIWIGTDKGITIYDGIDFKTINGDDGLSGKTVLCIIEDSHKNIWAGTDDGGLNKINLLPDDSVSIEVYNNDNGLGSNFIFDIHEDREGRLWLAAFYGGVNIMTFKGKDTVEIHNLRKDKDIPSDMILCIEEDTKGDLWFGTYDAGAFKITAAKGPIEGLVIPYNSSNGFNATTVWDIHCDKSGTLWFGTTENGLIKLSGSRFVNYRVEHGLPSNQVLNLTEDNIGNLWISAGGIGISMFVGDYFAHFSENDGLTSNRIFDIEQDNNGNYWLASNESGITRMNFNGLNAVLKNYTTKDGLINNFVKSLSKDPHGNLWIATAGGISMLSAGDSASIPKFTNYTESNGLINNEVKCILADSRGNVWCGTSYGISGFNGKKFIPVTEDQGLINNQVQTIIEDSKGNLWFGTLNGIAKYDKKVLVNYDHAEGLNDTRVNSLAEDSYGNIWIGTNGGGLYKFDTRSQDTMPIQFITNDKLLSSNIIYSLIFSDKKTLITGTSKGFDKITFDDSMQIIRVRNYNASDGFTGVETNQNAVFKDRDNNIWMGTVKGVTKYNPDAENENLNSPQTAIIDVRLFFKEQDWTAKSDSVFPWVNLPKALKLHYASNHLTFVFSGISLSNPEKVFYKYKLEGWDDEWSPPLREQQITYSGLLHGEYTFKVVAVNENGVWNEKPASFSFTIKPPWYKTIWFYLLCIILIVVAVYSYIKIRERKLQEEKKILEDKVRERTAEVVKQKEVIEEKNRDITDSIEYAQKIQLAILPRNAEIRRLLPNSFVLFKPRDIVSGDFYWISEHKGKIIIAVCDSTGHGVPGAFMSMIGTSLLNHVVNEKGITQPGEIFNGVRQGIISSLKQTGEAGQQKDGMDAVLCSIDDLKLSLACAKNSLIIVRKSGNILKYENGDEIKPNVEENGVALFEIKADKQPVGYYTGEDKPFTTHRLALEPQDMIYLLTDGFQDQFGGPKGKKFMIKNLKAVFIRIYNHTVEEQKHLLEKEIEEWKKHLGPNGEYFEQVDDICVIGVRF